MKQLQSLERYCVNTAYLICSSDPESKVKFSDTYYSLVERYFPKNTDLHYEDFLEFTTTRLRTFDTMADSNIFNGPALLYILEVMTSHLIDSAFDLPTDLARWHRKEYALNPPKRSRIRWFDYSSFWKHGILPRNNNPKLICILKNIVMCDYNRRSTRFYSNCKRDYEMLFSDANRYWHSNFKQVVKQLPKETLIFPAYQSIT